MLLKKCTELDGGHLEHIALEYTKKKQADPHHVLALYFKYNKLVVAKRFDDCNEHS